MTNYGKGIEYEDFVTQVYKAILEAEARQGKVVPKVIERNKVITSRSGTSAEIDLYWEYELANAKHSIAIECKNYNRNIDIPRVRDFAAKIEGIGGLKGIMTTTEGFSNEAIQLAKYHNIDLWIVRKPKMEDWEGRISGATVRMHVLNGPEVLKFEPKVNREWAVANGYKIGQPIANGFVPHNEIILEDKADGFKHDLHALRQNGFFENKGDGRHTWKREFKDGWLHIQGKILKLDVIEADYEQCPPTTTEVKIDFEDYVLAVMEFINGDQKKSMLLKDGQRRPF